MRKARRNEEGRGDTMNEKDLEQLGKLMKEAELLQRELNNLPTTKDSVRGYSPDFPYTERTIIISGIDEQRGKKLQRKLQRKLEQIQDKVEEMEEWLDSVEDPEIRTILRMMYRNNLNQKQIGEELGYDRSTVSKKLKKFWGEQ